MTSFPELPTPRRAAALRRRLLAWYRAHARPLPWRETRDPYAVWVSEAMLQQTRVETVEPYWRRFLESFPTLADLASAPEEQVLAHWSGLGYYRRARSLQAAAREMVAQHGGRFPDDPEAVRALPGIGPYTAGAVLSIAFDRPEPLVDGNVARVFARLFGLDAEHGSSPLARHQWELARRLVPERGAGQWNQALMELGALVCKPRDPDCGACPLAADCVARAQDLTDTLPRARPRPETVDVELTILCIERRGALLLERRPETGRMAGLWQLPTIEHSRSGLFPSELPRGPSCEPGRELASLRHSITRHRIRAVLREGTCSGHVRAPLAWIEREALAELPLTGMTRKALRLLASANGRAAERPGVGRPGVGRRPCR